MTMNLEDEFDISIPDEHMEGLSTIEATIGYLDKAINKEE
jgi:acyl carrier protein